LGFGFLLGKMDKVFYIKVILTQHHKKEIMAKTTEQLVKIASAGGGMILDATAKTTDQLVRIASASSQSGAKIIIANINSKTTDQLVKIASAGEGNVIFDLR
jgi:DNA replication protein